MKYFSKTLSGVTDTVSVVDLNDIKALMTSCKITMRLNPSASSALTVNLRGANGDLFELYSATSSNPVDITDIVLTSAALPGNNSPLSKVEFGATAATDVYVMVEKLED